MLAQECAAAVAAQFVGVLMMLCCTPAAPADKADTCIKDHTGAQPEVCNCLHSPLLLLVLAKQQSYLTRWAEPAS
jgi:hypothetical protein